MSKALSNFPIARRTIGWMAVLACVGALMVSPAVAAADVSVERSIIVLGSSEALWDRFGSFCSVADWDLAFKSCRFTKGQGDTGTVRRIERQNGGPDIVDMLVDVSNGFYRYQGIDGGSEGVFSMKPGPTDGTTLVTWRIAAGPNASPAFKEAISTRLGGAVQEALETLARLAGGSPKAQSN